MARINKCQDVTSDLVKESASRKYLKTVYRYPNGLCLLFQHLLPRKKTSEDNEWARNSSRFPSIEEVVYPTYWFPACDGPLSEPGSPTRAVSPTFGTKKATPG